MYSPVKVPVDKPYEVRIPVPKPYTVEKKVSRGDSFLNSSPSTTLIL